MKWLLGCIMLSWTCLLGSVQATQFVPLPIATLIEKSQLILQGKVLSKTALRDERGRIYTRIELQVDDLWKGSVASNRFTIVQAGGVLGDQGVVITGQAEFQIGEEIVAFLALNTQGEGIILGLAQGKFEVWKDPVTGEKYTHNLFHGLAPLSPAGAGVAAQSASGAGASLRVSDLKRQVTSASR